MNSHDQTIIDELNRSLDRIEKTAPMIGSYSRIEPRIIAQQQGGKSFRFIVFHIESQVWFDNSNIDASLLEFQQRRFLRPNDVAFDVGCNTGFVTTWLALELTQGHVHSFDPYPWNAVATRANAAINHCTNVTVHDVGLGLRDDSFLVPANSSRTYNTERYENVPLIEIKVRNPEHYAHFRPNFMKIDIEGAEHELSMTGLPKLPSLERGYVEIHPPVIAEKGENPRSFLDRLLAEGFTVDRVGDHVPMTLGDGQEALATGYFFRREIKSQHTV